MKNNTIVITVSHHTDGDRRDQAATEAIDNVDGYGGRWVAEIAIYRNGTVTRTRQQVTSDFRKAVQLQLDLTDTPLIHEAETIFGISIPI